MEVNDISTQTAQAMNEAAEAVTDLARQAQNLSALVEDLKRS